MSVMNKSADRSYPVDDNWLDRHQNDKSAYVDIQEIIDQTSSYVTELGLDPGVESAKADFVHTGIRPSNTASDVNIQINCQYMGDTFHMVRFYAGSIVHPARIKRIYAYDTNAEKIQWEGYTA